MVRFRYWKINPVKENNWWTWSVKGRLIGRNIKRNLWNCVSELIYGCETLTANEVIWEVEMPFLRIAVGVRWIRYIEEWLIEVHCEAAEWIRKNTLRWRWHTSENKQLKQNCLGVKFLTVFSLSEYSTGISTMTISCKDLPKVELDIKDDDYQYFIYTYIFIYSFSFTCIHAESF